jgi:SAM-dependent methyltransferase
MQLLRCPICHTQLAQVGNMLKCTSNHSFDIAKEGYVNLLRKPLPGDTKEMLLARRDFLERGFYQPLSDAINVLVVAHRPDVSMPLTILDAGCGEGYYLGRLQHVLSEQWDIQPDCVIGIDISKDAVRMAAKKYNARTDFIVANLKEPLALVDNVIHVLLNIFAPRNPSEFARVLAPGGLLIVAIPNPDHLQQIRGALHLLGIEEQKEQHVIEQFADHFSYVTGETVTYMLHLSRKEIEQVVMMTPNYWHLSDETRAAMAGLEEIETQISFTCLVLRRRAL